MEEISFSLKNTYPFCILSERFPEVTFYRWCNSSLDYLEFYGGDDDLDDVEGFLPQIEKLLGTNLIYRSGDRRKLTLMFQCRCSITNSTIRIAESDNCLWKAPVVYSGGKESINIIALKEDYLESLYLDFMKIGKVEITKKIGIEMDSLKDVYTISLSSLFNGITDRQLKLFMDALYLGYYSIPKKTNILDLAARNGISESTMEEHLNKAKAKILDSLKPYISLYSHKNFETKGLSDNSERD